MFDFDAGKFLIIGVVALVVIGPKELPRVLRQVGQAVSRMRRMAAEFQGQFMDAMKEADIESIRDEVKKLGTDASLATHFDPARDIQRELTGALDAPRAAAAVPAMTEIAAPTDGFVLPAPPPVDEGQDEGQDQPTTAAAGLAPAVATPEAHDADEAVAADAAADVARPAARKRKILLPKRRAAPVRVHAVTDRTAVPRGRLVLARVQDAAER